MSNLRIAAQYALEALENEHHSPRGPGYELSVYESRQTDAAITSLRAALAEPEQEPVRLQCTTCGTVYADGVPPQVAQPEQEPVAWQNPLHPEQLSHKPIPNWKPLYTAKN